MKLAWCRPQKRNMWNFETVIQFHLVFKHPFSQFVIIQSTFLLPRLTSAACSTLLFISFLGLWKTPADDDGGSKLPMGHTCWQRKRMDGQWMFDNYVLESFKHLKEEGCPTKRRKWQLFLRQLSSLLPSSPTNRANGHRTFESEFIVLNLYKLWIFHCHVIF